MSLFHVARSGLRTASLLRRPLPPAVRADVRMFPVRTAAFSSITSLQPAQSARITRSTKLVGPTTTKCLQKSVFHSSTTPRIWFQTASTGSAAIAGAGAAAGVGLLGRKKKSKLLRLLLLLVALGILDATYLSTQTESDECWQLLFLEHLPLRAMSHLWGWVNNVDLPIFMRAPIYYMWTWAFDCNLEEMRDPISSYRNLNQFFTRHLKPHVRPLGAAEMVSPVDGRVLVTGEVKGNTLVQRVKGAAYEVEGLLGYKPEVKNPTNQLYYIVIYLWPGDYHRMHAPNDFVAKKRAHIAGELFPVSPYFAHYVPGLFCRNERVVLTGEWRHGFYSFVPVGAYNVGSIRLSVPGDTDLQTNGPGQFLRMPITPHAAAPPQPFSTHDAPKYTARRPLPPIHSEVAYAGADGNGLQLKKGDEVAVFELGSTVVMVFEAPKDFRFRVMNGERVKMGQNLGSLSS